jgi:hypothetical protein
VHAPVEQERQHAHARQQLEQRLRRPGVAEQQLVDLARLLLRPLAEVPAVVQRAREQPVRGAVDHQPRHLDEEQPLAPRRAARRAAARRLAARAALHRERKLRGGRAALRAVHGQRVAAHLARLAAEVGVGRHHPVELRHPLRLYHLVQRGKRRAFASPSPHGHPCDVRRVRAQQARRALGRVRDDLRRVLLLLHAPRTGRTPAELDARRRPVP